MAIQWLKSFDAARKAAEQSGKLILLDFFNPN